MIFELSHENITTALREYMDRRNIINGKDFTFLMKTSRKGSKTSRVFITTVDRLVSPTVVEAPVAPVEALQEALVEVAQPVVEEPVQEEIEGEEEVKSTPFKKLFA